MATEEYFPRGGKKPTSTPYFKQSNFLGNTGDKKKRRFNNRKQPRPDDGYLSEVSDHEFDKAQIICAETLSLSVLQNGVLLLGRIKDIYETKVIVSLPAKMYGFVMACHISVPYNKCLQAYVDDEIEEIQNISSLFQKGEYVVVKVIQVTTDNKKQVMLSMMPQDINKEFNISKVQKGAVLRGAIESKEDHGYVIDLGIKDCHAFMPLNMVDESCNLAVGQVIWCTVTKSDNPNVIKVSNKIEILRDAVVKQKHDKKTLDCILPGMAVEFNIKQALPNGIEGQFFGDITGYILRTQVDLVKGKKPHMGEKIKAHLLYVLPTTKLPFFTMKKIFENLIPNLEEEKKLAVGQFVENAKVIKVTGRSIIFRLGSQCVGMMTLKHIKVDVDLDDEDVVQKSYPLGSEHKVRILNYYLCDYMYECTDERKLLNEKVLSYADLFTGQAVDATVTEIRDNGIQLKVGRLHGFVPTIHLSDVGLSVQKKKGAIIKNKFKIDQHVRARVLALDPERNRFILTLKSSLLDPDMEVLKSYNDAVVGKRYKGVIVSVGIRIVVSFFEDVRAMVSPKHVSREPIKDLSTAFHVGEIALCTILKVEPENKRMLVSFTQTPFEVGQKKQAVTDNSKINNKKRKIEQEEPTGEKKKTKKIKKQAEAEKVVQEELSGVDSVDFDEFVSSVLTEKDTKLLNVDSCVTKKTCKKRVTSLIKAINKKMLKMNKFERVLETIENKGITTKNKQFHTKINGNKLILQEQIKTFMEKVTLVQNKLKEFPPDEIELPKRKVKKVKENKAETKSKDVDYDSGVIDDINMDENLQQDSDDLHSAPRMDVEQPAVNESKKLKKKKSKKNKKDDSIQEDEEPSLTLPSVKDFWTASVQTKAASNSSSDSSDEEQVEVQPKKKKKLSAAEKVEKARQEEEKIRELEKQTILTDSQPQSSDQFERLLLANPDSSELWIAYMAFYLQGTEIDKARAVGRRALKTISFREEHEKLNVWLAMLNFENSFGTKESQDKTMEEALQMNDPLEVHLKMLEIYAETNKVHELSSLVDLMMRKYKGKPRVYVSAGNACYKCNLIDKGRFVMQKAIATLEKKEHVAVIVQFAKMERQYGEGERAEALLEQIVGVYPQRVDVWCVYVDMLMKSSDINNIRQVMERAVSHQLPARKMKTLFKKWIDIEEKLGSKEKIEEIREKALNFINKAKF